MSGRGRGISNAPAWMTRGNGVTNAGPPPHADDFGRFPRDPYPPPRRGNGPPRGFDNRRGPPPPSVRRRRDHSNSNNNSPNNANNAPSSSSRSGLITFRSYDEERDFLEARRRKRKARPSKFDAAPTAQQLAVDAAVMALSNPAATDFAGIPAGRDFSAVPQQTRHARRLYIGNLPPNITETELQTFFGQAIEQALVKKPTDDEDPILSVYINHERRFCFLEFRTVEMATACLALDGISIHGKGQVKVKRPNDYNPAMAPKVHPSAIPQLDVSKLGIISGTVQDGPNKVFIGGLHYHLTEDQVLELLQAFGKVKAFHLVKNEPDSLTSKGYCFVEYSDPNVTPIAVLGLNGMDLGGGKVLTARVAGERAAATAAATTANMLGTVPTSASTTGATLTQLPGTDTGSTSKPGSIIVSGYDIDELVDAAMGLKPMPTAPMHVDQFGVPITRAPPIIPTVPVPVAPSVAPQVPLIGLSPNPAMTVPGSGSALGLPPGLSALDIANAALNAAFGPGATGSATAVPPPAPIQQKTRVLVLHNMVTDEDLQTDDDYNGLKEEVEGEVAKFGKLLSMEIPRHPSAAVEISAIRKIYLEYATVQDSANAENELAGRQFGPNVVQISYYDEKEYSAGRLR